MHGLIYFMRYLIAIVFPWLSFILQGKIVSGVICLILQLTFLGWLPASVWAILSINKMYADRRTKQLIKTIQNK